MLALRRTVESCTECEKQICTACADEGECDGCRKCTSKAETEVGKTVTTSTSAQKVNTASWSKSNHKGATVEESGDKSSSEQEGGSEVGSPRGVQGAGTGGSEIGSPRVGQGAGSSKDVLFDDIVKTNNGVKPKGLIKRLTIKTLQHIQENIKAWIGKLGKNGSLQDITSFLDKDKPDNMSSGASGTFDQGADKTARASNDGLQANIGKLSDKGQNRAGGGKAKGKQPQEPLELCNLCNVTGKGPVWTCDVCKEGRCVESCPEKKCGKQICKSCADAGSCDACRKCTSTICTSNTKQPAASETNVLLPAEDETRRATAPAKATKAPVSPAEDEQPAAPGRLAQKYKILTQLLVQKHKH
jgi:hypothetical protein